ncbi:SSCRP protein [Trichoderma parareesei]|uniref:SSCRP protein n=1 Tax=Trichoderma parareesei TaxID=858221 RepID=A0A2H3A478_TRIPA|nr:SSCRP protein [Trichoderma parareesei]
MASSATAKASIFLLSLLATAVLARPPDITFLCDEMPEICANMCWAVRCAKPSFSQIFTFAYAPSSYGPSSNNKTSISGSCLTNDVCGNAGLNKTGHRGGCFTACNSYPFSVSVSSEDAPALPALPPPHHVSRCVPEAEQCRQQTQLDLFSKSLQQPQRNGTQQHGVRHLLINFGNPGGVRYCNNDPCINDGNEVQDGDVSRRWLRPEAAAPMFTYYSTKSGIVVASLEDVDMPSRFTRRVGSGELVPPGFRTWFERAMEESVQMMEDTIVQRLSDQSFGRM